MKKIALTASVCALSALTACSPASTPPGPARASVSTTPVAGAWHPVWADSSDTQWRCAGHTLVMRARDYTSGNGYSITAMPSDARCGGIHNG